MAVLQNKPTLRPLFDPSYDIHSRLRNQKSYRPRRRDARLVSADSGASSSAVGQFSLTRHLSVKRYIQEGVTRRPWLQRRCICAVLRAMLNYRQACN
jgi:hypothetical protein